MTAMRIAMDPEQLKRFDEASNHPYECKCDLCQEWWSLVPPEDDEDEDADCECGEDTCVCECPNQ